MQVDQILKGIRLCKACEIDRLRWSGHFKIIQGGKMTKYLIYEQIIELKKKEKVQGKMVKLYGTEYGKNEGTRL